MPILIVFGHLRARVAHQRLDVFLREVLLLVQSGLQSADPVEGGPFGGRNMVIRMRRVPGLAELVAQIVRSDRGAVILGGYLLTHSRLGSVMDQVGRSHGGRANIRLQPLDRRSVGQGSS